MTKKTKAKPTTTNPGRKLKGERPANWTSKTRMVNIRVPFAAYDALADAATKDNRPLGNAIVTWALAGAGIAVEKGRG